MLKFLFPLYLMGSYWYLSVTWKKRLGILTVHHTFSWFYLLPPFFFLSGFYTQFGGVLVSSLVTEFRFLLFQSHSGGLVFTKFGSSQTALLDLAFPAVRAIYYFLCLFMCLLIFFTSQNLLHHLNVSFIAGMFHLPNIILKLWKQWMLLVSFTVP